MSWLVGRFEPGELPWSRVEEMAEWIRALGVDPTHIALRAAVVQAKDGYELHLARHVLNADGKPFVNAAFDDVATEPVIVPVERDSWPAWLTGMGCGPKPATVQIRLDGGVLHDLVVDVLREKYRGMGSVLAASAGVS